MLAKLDISASDKYLRALMEKVCIKGKDTIEFEEFVEFIVHDRYHKY